MGNLREFEGSQPILNNLFEGYTSDKVQLKVMWITFEPRILSRLGKLYRAKCHQKIMDLVDMYNLGRPTDPNNTQNI